MRIETERNQVFSAMTRLQNAMLILELFPGVTIFNLYIFTLYAGIPNLCEFSFIIVGDCLAMYNYQVFVIEFISVV